MYFDVVPVVLVFLPFRVLTGFALTTYHATQLFTALFIIALFVLFRLLAKKFFQHLFLGAYLYLSVTFSVMSVWYAVSVPTMYCTAITAGMVWGIYFWVKALWFSYFRIKSVIMASIGSLYGTLAFGCRPTIALGNIIILCMIIYYLREKIHTKKMDRYSNCLLSLYCNWRFAGRL